MNRGQKTRERRWRSVNGTFGVSSLKMAPRAPCSGARRRCRNGCLRLWGQRYVTVRAHSSGARPNRTIERDQQNIGYPVRILRLALTLIAKAE
jgi:hypothetical protein